MRKQEFRFQTNLPSPARRCSRSRPPLRRPRPLRFERLRMSESAGEESIQPRQPRPCEVGRPKGRRKENRRNLTIFLAAAAPLVPVQFVRPAGVPTLRLAQSYAFTADFLATLRCMRRIQPLFRVTPRRAPKTPP